MATTDTTEITNIAGARCTAINSCGDRCRETLDSLAAGSTEYPGYCGRCRGNAWRAERKAAAISKSAVRATSQSSGRCPMYSRDDGCPLHGETCAPRSSYGYRRY